jgi:uncharacterized protein
MSISLRDQLLQAGLGKKAAPEKKTTPPLAAKKIAPPLDDGLSLAQAYAARERKEREAVEAQKKEAEAKARLKRENKQKVVALLNGKSLNVADAEIPRYFQYGKKIRRLFVTAEQHAAIAAGKIGIAHLDGRFMAVEIEVIDAISTIAKEYVALSPQILSSVDAPADGSADYDDPRFKVPDDLVW